MASIFRHKGLLGGRLNGRALQIGVCVTGSSGFLLLGYDQGVMSGIITEPIFLKTFPQMDPMNKSGAIQALVVAIYETGCLFGAIGIIAFGDKLGRRRSILTGACIMIVGAIIQTASVDLASIIVGRIVTGIGNGMNTSTIPVYQSEIAPPKIRGFLVLFEGALITLGITISYWLNYGFWFVTDRGSFQWRFPIGFQIFFAILLIIGILCFPESPRWLLKHNKVEEAAEIMGHLENAPPDSDQVQKDIKEIRQINAVSDGKKLTWREFFSNGREMNLWRASAGISSQAFQQIAPALAATVFIFVYDSFFALGWLGVTWLYPAEVTPIRIRAQAAGLSTCSNWIFNYAVVQLAPIMINTIAWKTY
ncbi:Major facilitator superfamily transporter mfsA, partial [Pseudocercospora fuligena]